MGAPAAYPAIHAERDRFVIDRRPPRPPLDPWRPQGLHVEAERTADGRTALVATIFLTGRECPWRCVMCDLWRFTTDTDTPRGALPAQIREATRCLSTLPSMPEHVKLYNAGSFFDPRAVPETDYPDMAAALRGFSHLVVESHPLLVGRRLETFRDACARAAGDAASPTLEVAMGLETSHPIALEALHKRFTLEQFARAADRVRRAGAALRVFLLVGVPFIAQAEQRAWLRRSIETAFASGASMVSLIPTRSGNGALEALQQAGSFTPPSLDDLETALEIGLALGCAPGLAGPRSRVCADLWDLDRLATCVACLDARRARLQAINLQQQILPRIACAACGPTGGVA